MTTLIFLLIAIPIAVLIAACNQALTEQFAPLASRSKRRSSR